MSKCFGTALGIALILAGCQENQEPSSDTVEQRRPLRQYGPDPEEETADQGEYRAAVEKRLRVRESLLDYELAVEEAKLEVTFAQRRVGFARERANLMKGHERFTWLPTSAQSRLDGAERGLEQARDQLDAAQKRLRNARDDLEGE